MQTMINFSNSGRNETPTFEFPAPLPSTVVRLDAAATPPPPSSTEDDHAGVPRSIRRRVNPPPAFDDGDTFDDLGVDGDAYLASLLDKAGGDLAAESQAALDDPDALAALVAKREAEESTAAEVDSLKASIAEKARRVLDHPSSPARVHNKTGVLGRELMDGLATSLADDARALEVPTTSPMSEARKAAERERLAAALARRRDASAKYGRVDPADKRRWPSKRENERRLRELEDARKSYERRYPPAKIDAGGGLRLPARVDAQPRRQRPRRIAPRLPQLCANRARGVTTRSRPTTKTTKYPYPSTTPAG